MIYMRISSQAVSLIYHSVGQAIAAPYEQNANVPFRAGFRQFFKRNDCAARCILFLIYTRRRYAFPCAMVSCHFVAKIHL